MAPNCLRLILNAERRRKARNPSNKTPASNMRAAVKNRGGEISNVHFPSAKTLDQVAYKKITRAIDMRLNTFRIASMIAVFFEAVKGILDEF